jgi:hypothetical protein
MNEESFIDALRKFLREVGVTSQQQIERAVGASGKKSGPIRLKMTLTSEDIPLNHTVERTVELKD